MKKLVADVEKFMVACGQTVSPKPEMPTLEIRKLRLKLIAEELTELADAYGVELFICKNDEYRIEITETETDLSLVESIDADIDLLYVVLGDIVCKGINPEPFWDEVQRSNMSKFIDGYRRADGKWMKGKSYSPANLQPILDHQIGQGTLFP
jgi:predicted HAD superfamily Cof-like phosphohydrolase